LKYLENYGAQSLKLRLLGAMSASGFRVGLIARGIVTLAEATAKKRGIERQTPRVRDRAASFLSKCF
jgi:hypothetical protein